MVSNRDCHVFHVYVFIFIIIEIRQSSVPPFWILFLFVFYPCMSLYTPKLFFIVLPKNIDHSLIIKSNLNIIQNRYIFVSSSFLYTIPICVLQQDVTPFLFWFFFAHVWFIQKKVFWNDVAFVVDIHSKIKSLASFSRLEWNYTNKKHKKYRFLYNLFLVSQTSICLWCVVTFSKSFLFYFHIIIFFLLIYFHSLQRIFLYIFF